MSEVYYHKRVFGCVERRILAEDAGVDEIFEGVLRVFAPERNQLVEQVGDGGLLSPCPLVKQGLQRFCVQHSADDRTVRADEEHPRGGGYGIFAAEIRCVGRVAEVPRIRNPVETGPEKFLPFDGVVSDVESHECAVVSAVEEVFEPYALYLAFRAVRVIEPEYRRLCGAETFESGFLEQRSIRAEKGRTVEVGVTADVGKRAVRQSDNTMIPVGLSDAVGGTLRRLTGIAKNPPVGDMDCDILVAHQL